jgi:uncharacterized protein (DUF1330 family)
MSTYAIARVRKTNRGAGIVAYLQRIDATLRPFEGRFKVHGDEVELLEGNWTGDLIIIEFPDRERARGWYASHDYRAIARLRTDNSEGELIFIDTVPEGHLSTDLLVSR